MTNAFITGATGFVGSHLIDFLLENTDWDIHGLIRWRSPLDNIAHHLDRVNRRDRLFLHYGDLNDEGSIRAAINEARPDYVFHLAAQSYPQTSFTAPIDTLNTNVLGTARLLDILKTRMKFTNANPHIHICSSSEVFGRVPKEKTPIQEDCSFHPASPYAISKTGTDLLAQHYAEAYGLNVQVTRMFTHTGPRRGDVFAESSFAKQIAMIEAGLQDPVIKVGNLGSMRTWADVRDAVRAYYMLLTINPILGAVYNIGGDFSCTVGDMLSALLKNTYGCIYRLDISNFSEPKYYVIKEGDITIEQDPDRLRPIDADLQIPDTSKFRNHTGWAPQIPFEQTTKDLLDYWRKRIKTRGAFLNR